MMKPFSKYAFRVMLLFMSFDSVGQGMHFSQYYNAPLLLNPANTALLPDADYQIGVNYRNQWASVPVPYRTFSAYGDLQLLRNRNESNWLGVGLSFWNDKAGDGQLTLSRSEAFLAYHIQLGEKTMISAGASAAYAARSFNINELTFDKQWDGFQFDRSKSSGEKNYVSQTNFFDLSAGVNLAYFPNENVYLKLGVGVAHINQPKESFFDQDSRMGLRPTVNVDLLAKLSTSVILNPSIYYTTQKAAMELVYGTQLQINVSGAEKNRTSLILGAYHRWNEAVIAVAGMDYNHFKLVASYDITVSSLGKEIQNRGAFELGLLYQGLYGAFSRERRTYNCPRF